MSKAEHFATYLRRRISGVQCVGYYDVNGDWHTTSRHPTAAFAEDCAVYMNGGETEWSLKNHRRRCRSLNAESYARAGVSAGQGETAAMPRTEEEG